jgi:hypothetical protein
MRSTEDLIDAIAPLQLEAGTSEFIDFPIPGVETYYAVLDTETFKLGKQVLVPGENTTDGAVMIPMEVSRVALMPPSGTEPPGSPESRDGTGSPGGEAVVSDRKIFGGEGTSTDTTGTRPPVSPRQPGQPATTLPLASTPLPYLQLAGDTRNTVSVPRQRTDLDPMTQAAVSRVLSTAPPPQASQAQVVILPEDRGEPAAGESASLHNILRDTLLAGDFTEAESRLLGFLNLRRSSYTEARVRFYLAQAYYFQGLYEEALLEFVLAQGELYAPVQPWIESCFRHLWE